MSSSMSGHEPQRGGITISLSTVVGYLRRLRRSRRYRRDEKEAGRRQMNGRLGRSRDSEDPVLEPQDMPESSGGSSGGGGGGMNGGAAGVSGASNSGGGGSGSGGGRDSCPTAIKLFAARYFKFLCGAGVFLGTVSFILSIIAIATDQWLQAELIYQEVPTVNYNDTEGGNINVTKRERISTGIWNLCFENHVDGVLIDASCHPINSLLRSLEDDAQRTFFQSLAAFEVISTAATLTGCTVAMIAMSHQQPLAMLVAGFTMLFSGLFMLVGHLMMLTAHQETGDMERASVFGELFKNADSSNYGWSFIVAWISFVLCVSAGFTDFLVYRNFRKITDELHNTPSRVKYMHRQPPVNLGPTI